MSNLPMGAVLIWVQQLLTGKNERFRKIRKNIESLNGGAGVQNFVAIGLVDFAVQFCVEGVGRSIDHNKMIKVYFLVQDALLADPITDDIFLKRQFEQSHYLPLLMRTVRSQMNIGKPWGLDLARSTLLWNEAANQLTGNVDFPGFKEAFRITTGVTLNEYLSFALTLVWTASGVGDKYKVISRRFFFGAIKHGRMKLTVESLRICLEMVVGDKYKFSNYITQTAPRDIRFFRYRRSPLVHFPIVRPDSKSKFLADSTLDRMIIPIPYLVKRLVTHLPYTLLRDDYGNHFVTYFGHVFSLYVGRLLKELPHYRVFHEDELMQLVPGYSGKRPDWALYDGRTLLLIECKGAQFPDYSLLSGGDEGLSKKLTKIIKSRKQAEEFSKALNNYGVFETCDVFRGKGAVDCRAVTITWDWYPMLNSEAGRDYLGKLLDCGDDGFELSWVVLSIREFELLHPLLEQGVDIGEVFASDNITDYVHQQECSGDLLSEEWFMGKQVKVAIDSFIGDVK